MSDINNNSRHQTPSNTPQNTPPNTPVKLPNDSTNPDKGVLKVDNPAPDPTTSNRGHNCPDLPSSPPRQVEPPAGEAADTPTCDDDVPDDSNNHIDVNKVTRSFSMSARDFFQN
ncbi:hypothetical protein VTI28DRAFT_5488 [Corynascus sepedonium]